MTDVIKNYGNALADLLELYAERMTTKDGSEATHELIQSIGDGSARVAIVATLTPFSVAAVRLDDPDTKLFEITDGGLH
jgi:hypothetical protein